MGRDARHTAQIRAANQARDAAIRILIERHREEFDAIHAAEAESRGVTARRVGTRKVKSKDERLEEARRALKAPVTVQISSTATGGRVVTATLPYNDGGTL